MLYLASYDIDDNTVRLKVANCLLAAGLERLQRSVFVGSMDEAICRQLLNDVGHCLKLTKPASNRFVLMPLAEAYARKAYWIGNDPPDWTYHCQQTLTLVF